MISFFAARRLYLLIFLFLLGSITLWWVNRSSRVALRAIKLPSGHVFLMEDSEHRQLQLLRQEEKLDRVVAGKATDMEKISELMEWARSRFEDSSPLPNYPPFDARLILQMIRSGKTGGFCAQFCFVFAQACQSLGYDVRYFDLTSLDLSADHFVVEVFVADLNKWVVFDVQNKLVYSDKNGIPLSVMEIHQHRFDEKPTPIYEWPSRQPTQGQESMYAHFQYYLRNNYLSHPVYYKIQPLGFDPEKEYNGRKGRLVCQWVFEPYTLRYIDSRLGYRRDNAYSMFTSSNVADFEFRLEGSTVQARHVTTSEDLRQVFHEFEPLVDQEIQLPQRVLASYVATYMNKFDSYEILDRPGESLVRYDRIQDQYRQGRHE